jgi:subtilisin family serine protease
MAILLVALVPAPGQVEGQGLAPGPPTQRASVHPLVWESLEGEPQVEVLLLLRAQADLSAARALPDREAKARFAFDGLRAVAEASQRPLRALLEAEGAEYQGFYLINAIKVRAGGGLLRTLAARPDIARIVPNPRVRGVPTSPLQPASAAPNGIEPNLVRVNADDVWALGYTGQGVVVAGQDTGYDWDHPALKSQYRGWDGAAASHDYNWHDAVHAGGGLCGADSPEPCDDHSHGTHTMGTIVGDDGGAGTAGNQIGVAPGAQWIGCRNMDQGYGTPATYIECFEFFLAPYPVSGTPAQGDPSLAPHVINNSWSCPPSEGCDPGTLEAAVETVRQAGIVVVASGGNSGPYCGSVDRPPALYQQSFSIGAFDHSNDQIAGFSSRGPVTYGGQTYNKPDIAAPGVSIRSSVPGGGYGYSSGTSMAGPHVTGAVALLLSANPSLQGQVAAIEGILTGSAEPKLDAQCGEAGPPNAVWGWGILDIQAAIKPTGLGTLTGTVTDASTEEPIAGAKVTALPDPPSGPASAATTDPTGGYTLSLETGRYTVTVQAAGYRQQESSVTLIPGEPTTLDFALEPQPQPVHRIFILFGIPGDP